MNTKRKIYPGFPVLILLLLGFIGFGSLQAAQLRLIKEEQIVISPKTDIRLLGKPKIDATGQGQLASILFQEADKQPVIRAEGTDVPLQNIPEGAHIIHYDSQGVGYIQTKWLDIEAPEGTFTWKPAGGQRPWQVTHMFLGEVRVSTEMGAVLLVRQDLVNFSPNSSGVYVYNLHTGQLLKAFESPNWGINEYEFSGDSNRLVFEYEISKPRSEMTEADYIDPRVHLACMDIGGQILWDIEMQPVHGLSVSYDGNRVIYTSELPHHKLAEKLGRQLYRKLGLINNGNLLWEIDQPSGLHVELLPSGDYFSTSLYTDQSRISDPTAEEGPSAGYFFETSTRKILMDLSPPEIGEGWFLKFGSKVLLDNQRHVRVYSRIQGDVPWGAEVGEPSGSLLALQNYVTSKIEHQQALPGEVYKLLTSADMRVIELLFVDGRRMLFEVVPE